MSEYQYYEFAAIDRPLTGDEMAELRALSTRAEITPVSFTNEYNWGDFKGDPDKLMQRYFDVHVYVANWRTAIFMVRLPFEALPRETAQTLVAPYLLDIKADGACWIITWRLDESENYDRFAIESGCGWMARLAPVRDELLLGDLRSLYIGWLAAVAEERKGDDEMEPVAVIGLQNLTAAQQALAEFLEVDPDLLAGAGTGSPAAPDAEIPQRAMDKWIDALSRDEINLILKQLLGGKGRQAERSVKNRFAAWHRGLQPGGTDVSRRTVGELRQNAGKIRLIRLKKLERDRKQREIQRREKRRAHLKKLSGDFPGAWASVRESIELGSGRGYDEACHTLLDIAEACDLYGARGQFQIELKKFMAGYLRRRALVQRLVKAGIWEGKS